MRKRRLKTSRDRRPSQAGVRPALVRGALALGALILGAWSTAASLANVVAKADPALAHRLSPGNGALAGEYAEHSFAAAPTKDPHSLPARIARQALLADATAAPALTVLASQAQLRNDAATARRVFAYSSALSRRELRPRVWAIEEAVSRGDIKEALRNYDIALRTSTQANNLLFPTLAAALSEKRIRAELMPIIVDRPVWAKDFLEYVSSNGPEPEGAMAFFQEGQAAGLTTTDRMRADLVDALAAKGKYSQAWAYYRSFRRGAVADRSRDPRFALRTDARTVFDWKVGAELESSASLSARDNGGMLDFQVPPGTGGELASQVQLLPPGAYELRGRSAKLAQPAASLLNWVLACVDGRELGRAALIGSDRNGGRFSGRYTIPAGCGVQKLSLVARPTDDIMGIEGQILYAELVPVGK